MTSKLSFGLAANERSGQSGSEREDGEDGVELASDPGTEIVVDASEDVTVEAQEDVTMEALAQAAQDPSEAEPDGAGSEETPAPLAASVPEGRSNTQTLLGMLAPSLPLPGVTASARDEDEELVSLGPEIASEDEDDDEPTVMARPVDRLANIDRLAEMDDPLGDRPSITDDEEEETKVEPVETAVRAAASRADGEDIATALSEQASLEREKALRKSGNFAPISSPSGLGRDDLEFADPDDDEAIGAADLLEEEDDQAEAAGAFPKSSEPSPLAAAFTARRLGSPPLGTPFGTARLPTPGPGFGGLSLASPVQVPAPTSSPFGRLPAPGVSSASRTPGSLPALQIPAPSGAAAAAQPPGPSALFRKVSVPIVGLMAIGGGVLGLGFLVGYQVSGNRAPVVVTAPVAAPVVQPVRAEANPAPSIEPAAPSPGEAKPIGEETAAAPLPAAQAGQPAIEPIATDSPPPTPRPAKRVVSRPKKTDSGDDDLAESTSSRPVAKSSSKPKSSKPSKGWVDPFAD